MFKIITPTGGYGLLFTVLGIVFAFGTIIALAISGMWFLGFLAQYTWIDHEGISSLCKIAWFVASFFIFMSWRDYNAYVYRVYTKRFIEEKKEEKKNEEKHNNK